jgi:arylsulfatase A-like enzyme
VKRAFVRQLAVSVGAMLGAALGEALAVLLRAPGAAPWSLGLWALPGVVVSPALAWLLAVLCGEESVEETLRRAGRSELGASALCSALLFGGAYLLSSAVTRFHNVELAGALLALGVSALVLVLAVIRGALVRASPRWLPWLAVTATLTIGSLVGWSCRGGLAQLDARLLLAPLGFVLGLVVFDRWILGWLPAKPVVLGTSGFLFVAALPLLGAGPRVAASVTSSGAWSRPLVALWQQLSDVDRDGYSNLLGGGDCAPLDPQINPSALEVAGDGVDNNCVGGDAGKAIVPKRPVWGASVHGAPTNQNVVIITIETLRHDHASFVRAARDTTPNLRKLGESSLVFERMYSAAPYTRLALASLFSSYAPSEIDWQPLPADKRARHISPETPWLPELLSARGYETIAVTTDFSAFTEREDIGFERGFRHYDTSTQLGYRGGTMWGFPAAEQVDKALGYVQRAKRPFLLWLHLFEPHFRYEQPPGAPVFGTDEQARYDAEIWHVDSELGRLFDGLKAIGAWDDTVLFVSGDHGEAFGEHDDKWHGTNLFDPMLRPAALLRVPGVRAQRVDAAVTFTDIAPTLTRVLGDRQSFEHLRGRSLAPLMHHRTLPADDAGFIAETFTIADGKAYQAALVAHPLKLIYDENGGRFSLYDLQADPGERRPSEPAEDPRAQPLMRELVGYLERARRREKPKPSSASPSANPDSPP